MVDAHDGLLDFDEVAQYDLQGMNMDDIYENVSGSERRPLSDPDGINTSIETSHSHPMTAANTCDFHQTGMTPSEQRI